MVLQRIWDIVLDLIVLSSDCSKLMQKLWNPMVKGKTGKFED